jgi:hypothetical protein
MASLLTPEQHRREAVRLRANPSPRAQELAKHHDNLAKLIEHRDGARKVENSRRIKNIGGTSTEPA